MLHVDSLWESVQRESFGRVREMHMYVHCQTAINTRSMECTGLEDKGTKTG